MVSSRGATKRATAATREQPAPRRTVSGRDGGDCRAVALLCVTAVLFILYMSGGWSGGEEGTEQPLDVTELKEIRPIKARKTGGVAPHAPTAHTPLARAQHLRGGDVVLAEAKARGWQRAVVQEFMHAYDGYKSVAWGHDEVRPESNITNDSWGGFAVTLIDSLDTMMLMGLAKQVAEVRGWIAKHLDFEKDWDASFFEFSIRYLGGLLSAYELSDDALYLEKAKSIGDRLLPAFETKSGIPYPVVNLKTGKARTPSWNSGRAVLAEFGSVQLEFKQLGHHLNNRTYFEKADRVMDVVRAIPREQYMRDGVDTFPLLPVYLQVDSGQFPSGHISIGAMGDSYSEYLLKQWLQSERKDARYRDMYDQFVDRLESLLITTTVPSGFTIVGEHHGRLVPTMDHLVCFLPGTLALGAEGKTKKKHMSLAKRLMETCWQLYSMQPTGLAAEVNTFQTKGNEWPKGSYDEAHPDIRSEGGKQHYLLRPETIESLFWLWRKTRDPQYREKGWAIFKAIRQHCRTPTAYSGIKDVRKVPAEFNDSMQSFALAETFKYLFLLFSDEGDHHLEAVLKASVFTTEAHPLKAFDVIKQFEVDRSSDGGPESRTSH